MLKDNTTTLWIRNMQMYFTGMISAGLACLIKEGWGVYENGFFYGYYDLVYIIIGKEGSPSVLSLETSLPAG